MSSISKMRPENIKLMSTVAVFFCDVAFRLEPDKGPLYVLSSRLTSNILTAATNTKKDLAHVSVLTLSTILF